MSWVIFNIFRIQHDSWAQNCFGMSHPISVTSWYCLIVQGWLVVIWEAEWGYCIWVWIWGIILVGIFWSKMLRESLLGFFNNIVIMEWGRLDGNHAFGWKYIFVESRFQRGSCNTESGPTSSESESRERSKSTSNVLQASPTLTKVLLTGPAQAMLLWMCQSALTIVLLMGPALTMDLLIGQALTVVLLVDQSAITVVLPQVQWPPPFFLCIPMLAHPTPWKVPKTLLPMALTFWHGMRWGQCHDLLKNIFHTASWTMCIIL